MVALLFILSNIACAWMMKEVESKHVPWIVLILIAVSGGTCIPGIVLGMLARK